MSGLLPSGTVLVVEDDSFVRAMTRDVFSDLGCEVLDAYNAIDALAIAVQHPEIKLAFVDVRMPGEMDGVALAAVLHQTHPTLKVVLTSGHGRPGVEGFDFLPKPWHAKQIVDLLRTAMVPRSTAA
jgi:CheY-like chemotaxis protein